MLALRPMPRWPLTRRSTFLAIFGVIFVIIGYSLMTAPDTRRSLPGIFSFATLDFWGALWIACGLIAFITGALRWLKSVGFAALMFVSFLWGGAFLISWVAGDLPRGWVQASVFFGLAAAVYTVAGMVERDGQA